MRIHALPLLCVLVVCAFAATPARANDVDGPDDCARDTIIDYGDAPEGFEAYPGVIGKFPTCLAPGPTSVVTAACPLVSTLSDVAGFVRHVQGPDGYWLACVPPGSPPRGIDSDAAPKTSLGAPVSACDASVTVDATESASGLSFGQDEAYGGDDAGITAPVRIIRCTSQSFPISTYNCSSQGRTVYLNVLIDWNHDGDWNDNFYSCADACSYEWAVKNVQRWLPPGGQCDGIFASFYSGPYLGVAWMRVTISDQPVPDDFPWNGSAGVPGQSLHGGETEDYPIEVVMQNDADVCGGEYNDFGDAPEGIPAYPNGVIGHFPSCLALTAPGTQEVGCTSVSSAPGQTGHVLHSKLRRGFSIWLGCGANGSPGVDGELDAKFTALGTPGGPSACGGVATDCVEQAFGAALPFGQDECAGDNVDAAGNVVGTTYGPFGACEPGLLRVRTRSCPTIGNDCFHIFNVLIDWNMDGDWNDTFLCPESGECIREWAVKNQFSLSACGCDFTFTGFRAGPFVGKAWMRVTVSLENAPDDFPWNGTRSLVNGYFQGGETEDHVVEILPTLAGVPEGPETRVAMGAPRPNPSIGDVLVPFTLPRATRVSLSAYDASGRRVRVLLADSKAAGAHEARWDFRDDRGRALPVGVYWIRLEVDGMVHTRKVSRVE